MFVSGDLQTREVQANQPLKFAAMEGVFTTSNGVALDIIGLPPSQTGPAAIPPIAIPYGLSAMTNLDPNSQIKGLDQEPDKSLWPPVGLTWMSFHLMVGLGVVMMLLMLFGAFFWWRRSLETKRWWLRLAVLAIPLPIIAVELGWMTAEVGRQPWIVQGLMMTTKGVSPGVSATDVGISLIAILVVYALLFFLWIYALVKEIGRGPELAPSAPVVAAPVVAPLRSWPPRRRPDEQREAADMPSLQTVWFVLIGLLLVGYAVLDGFDLGAGIVHLFVARNDEERRSVLNAIGPVWDGNEVWLITGGGALFAAFPLVYATVFSGFYLAVMLLLGALILRAVSIEFRSKETNGLWRRSWDAGFALGSALAALLFGVALGNVVRGLPLDAGGVYRGGLAGLLNPFAIVMGLLTLGLAAQQGSSWLVLKTEGALQARARIAGLAATLLVVAAWIVATVIAWGDSNRIFDNFGRTPLAWTGPVAAAIALAAMLYAYRRRRELLAFLLSSVVVAGLAVTAGATLYPNLVPAVDATRSLTVDNAHSSDVTLTVMLVVALVGMPIVLAYTGFVYWKFKGKVQLDEAGY